MDYKLIIGALAPVLAVILYIYFNDKHEKEPKHLLFYNFIYGAVISVIITLVLYQVFDVTLPITNNKSVIQQVIKAFLVVGFSEELSKYLIVRFYAQKLKAFNEPYDGIAYAVMVSMGFAATENILYVMSGGWEIAVARAFTAVPAHATFGVLMGYFMGKAKFSKNKRLLNLSGLLLAIIFHGTYDVFLFLNFIPGIAIGAFISLILGIFLSWKAIKIHQQKSFFKS